MKDFTRRMFPLIGWWPFFIYFGYDFWKQGEIKFFWINLIVFVVLMLLGYYVQKFNESVKFINDK